MLSNFAFNVNLCPYTEWSPLLEAALGAWEFAAAAVLERERSVGHLEQLATQVETELASEAGAYTRPLLTST
jgi:hypothetical protein